MRKRNPPDPSCGRCAADQNAQILQLSETEDAALSVMRLFFSTYAKPNEHHWRVAYTVSAHAFGARRGAYIAFALMQTVETMSRSRKSVFHFSNPGCPRCRLKITECEERLLKVLRACRSGDGATAQTQSLLLCEGNPTQEFLGAAREAAVALDAEPWNDVAITPRATVTR